MLTQTTFFLGDGHLQPAQRAKERLVGSLQAAQYNTPGSIHGMHIFPHAYFWDNTIVDSLTHVLNAPIRCMLDRLILP